MLDKINKLNTVNKSTTDLKPLKNNDSIAAYTQGEIDPVPSTKHDMASVRSSTSILEKLKDRNMNKVANST